MKKILYTEEEVKHLCIKAYLAAIETTGEGFNGEICTDVNKTFKPNAEEWFNANKKLLIKVS